MSESMADRIRAAISDSYYDARNDGLTMEHAADQATAKVMQIVADRIQELLARYGKTSDQLADEAEKGYDIR